MTIETWRWRLKSAVNAALLSMSDDHIVRRMYRGVRRAPGVTSLWRAIAGGPIPAWSSVRRYVREGGEFLDSGAAAAERPAPAFDDEPYFPDLLSRIAEARASYEPVVKRVVLVNNGLAAGGAERQIVYTLKGLKDAGWDPHFIGEYLGRAPGLDFHRAAVEAAGVPVLPLESLRQPGPALYAGVTRAVAEALSQAPADFLLETLNMAEMLRRLRPAIVHLWQDDTATRHAFAALIAGAPRTILSGRNVNPTNFVFHRPHMRAAYQALARRPDIVFSNNSHAGARSYAEWLGLDSARIRVIHNGVDFAHWPKPPADARARFRAAHGVPQEALLVAGVFRLAPEKRPILWVEAAAEALRLRPDLHFAIAGDGPLMPDARGRAHALGLEDRVRFLGERAAIGELLAAADALFLASEHEGLPNVLLEAQWAGLPSVTTAAGGAPEAILHGKTGMVAEGNTPAELGASLVQLLNDAALREQARTAGPAFVSDAFSVSGMIERTISCYQEGSLLPG